MSLPYNYQQVLEVLRDNREGLTTAQIVARCQKMPMNKVNNNNECSRFIYSLRNSSDLTTSEAAGGKIHKITEKGLSKIKQDIGSAPDETPEEILPIAQNAPEAAAIASSCEEKTEDSGPARKNARNVELGQDPLADIEAMMHNNIMAEFNDAMTTIHDVMMLALNQAAPVKIADKTRKIATLEQGRRCD